MIFSINDSLGCGQVRGDPLDHGSLCVRPSRSRKRSGATLSVKYPLQYNQLTLSVKKAHGVTFSVSEAPSVLLSTWINTKGTSLVRECLHGLLLASACDVPSGRILFHRPKAPVTRAYHNQHSRPLQLRDGSPSSRGIDHSVSV